jgi:hypothetical protein
MNFDAFASSTKDNSFKDERKKVCPPPRAPVLACGKDSSQEEQAWMSMAGEWFSFTI